MRCSCLVTECNQKPSKFVFMAYFVVESERRSKFGMHDPTDLVRVNNSLHCADTAVNGPVKVVSYHDGL